MDNTVDLAHLGNLVLQHNDQWYIYANGRSGSTGLFLASGIKGIMGRELFKRVCHILEFDPTTFTTVNNILYAVIREPQARLLSALYQMHTLIYPVPDHCKMLLSQEQIKDIIADQHSDINWLQQLIDDKHCQSRLNTWREQIATIEHGGDMGGTHKWGGPLCIEHSDKVHIQNYLSDLKQLTDSWPDITIKTIYMDLQDLDQFCVEKGFDPIDRVGTNDTLQLDYALFKQVVMASASWPLWCEYLKPEKAMWHLLLGKTDNTY